MAHTPEEEEEEEEEAKRAACTRKMSSQGRVERESPAWLVDDGACAFVGA